MYLHQQSVATRSPIGNEHKNMTYIFRDIGKKNKMKTKRRSSGGRVVKLLACGARGPGFDSPPRHLNFQRLVISCFQVEIWLKDR